MIGEYNLSKKVYDRNCQHFLKLLSKEISKCSLVYDLSDQRSESRECGIVPRWRYDYTLYSLAAIQCFHDGYVGKQRVAREKYCAKP